MEKIINSLSKYILLETIIPGLTFILLYDMIIAHIDTSNTLFVLILAYFIGTIISRLSSLVTKKMLFKMTKEKGISYYNYIKATQYDDKIEELSTHKNLYRNFATLCFLILILKIIESTKIKIFIYKNDCIVIVLLICLVILFSASFLNMNKRIIKRAKITISKRKKTLRHNSKQSNSKRHY